MAVADNGFYPSNPIVAILKSFMFGLFYMMQWFKFPIVLLLILIMPILFNIAKKQNFSFKLPFWVTFFSFCFFCTQFTPTLYATSTPGPNRVLNIAFSLLLLLTIFNVIYWLGWFQRSFNLNSEPCSKLVAYFKPYKNISIMFVLSLVFISTMLTAFLSDQMGLSASAKSTRELLSGTAQSYGEPLVNAMTELHKDDKDVTITFPLEDSKSPYVLDLVYENPYQYFNDSSFLEDFFHKDSVTIVKE